LVGGACAPIEKGRLAEQRAKAIAHRGRYFKGPSITNLSDLWQAGQRNVEKSELSSLASSTAIPIVAPHSEHFGMSSITSG
jgi:hypothetical protein